MLFVFFFQAEDGIRDYKVTGVQTCALPILAPIVADLARQYEGRIKVGHIDVEGSPATAAQFGVMSVPTLIFFKGGKPADQLVGAVSRQVLEKTIQKVLA